MSTLTYSEPTSSRLGRLDCRVRVALDLLRGAERQELVALAGMAAASITVAWPVPDHGYGYALVAVPGSVLLAAFVRLHGNRLDDRREALAAAGANPADTAVITAVAPLVAAAAGSLVGTVISVLTDHPAAAARALLPLLVAAVMTFVIRRSWVEAPALAVSAVAAMVASIAVSLSAPGGASTALVASTTSPVSTEATAAAWSHDWLPAVAAALVLVAAQAAGRKLQARSRG